MVVKLENTNNTPITNTTPQESKEKPASSNSVMVTETNTSSQELGKNFVSVDVEVPQAAVTSNVIKTLDDFEKEVEKKFNQKGIKYSTELLKKIIGNLPSKVDFENNNPIINQYLNIISKVLDKCVKNGTLDESASKVFKEYKIGLASGWTADEFEKRNKEYSKNFNIKEAISKFEELSKKENISKEELKKEFGLILANATDEEKLELYDIIKIKFSDDISVVQLIFDSFESNNGRKTFADKMQFENFREEIIRSKFEKNMSSKKLLEMMISNNTNYQELVKTYGEKIVKENLEKITNGELDINNPDLSEIQKKLISILGTYKELTVVIANSEVLEESEKTKLTEQLTKITNTDATLHQAYIKTLAEYVTKNHDILNIDVDKFKDFIKKVTGNDEFSRALDNIAEKKSAVDSETNMFKIPSEETKNTAQVNAGNLSQIIKKQTQEAGGLAQQTEPVSPIEKVKTFLADKEFDTNIPIFETKEYANNTFKAVKAIFTGKVKVASQDEDKALDKYKILNSAEQKFVLEYAKNSWLREIIENTKDSVMLAFTGVGANFYATKEIENAQKEHEQKEIC